MKCAKCGHKNADNSKYCGSCGTRLLKVLPPPLPNGYSTSADEKLGRDTKSVTDSKTSPFWIILIILLLGTGVYLLLISRDKGQETKRVYVSQESESVESVDECRVKEDTPLASFADDVYEPGATDIEYVSGSFCYEGRFFDDDEDNPVRLEFERNGSVISNCVYTNVQLGGKIKMKAEITDYGYIFRGKDGYQDFIMDLDSYYGGYELKGTASVGKKVMNAVLNLKNNR